MDVGLFGGNRYSTTVYWYFCVIAGIQTANSYQMMVEVSGEERSFYGLSLVASYDSKRVDNRYRIL